MDSHTILFKNPRVIQDSPKEDFILCEECEAYFSVLEGIASELFINWRTKVASGEYSLQSIFTNLVDILNCNDANSQTIYLLIYSLFWRASVSNVELYADLKIESNFEEELRETFMLYRHGSKSDYINSIKTATNFKIHPVWIATASTFMDETANLIYAPFSYDPYSLIVDRFTFTIFRTPNELSNLPKEIINLINTKITDCKIMVFSPQMWHEEVVKRPLAALKKQSENHRLQ